MSTLPIDLSPTGWTSRYIHVAANQDIEDQLHATPSQISWSLSLFILVQGNVPLLWAVISEIKGRKVITIISNLLE